MQEMLFKLLPTLEHFTITGYWIMFAFAFAESLAFVGLIIPGTTAIILAGFLSSKGVFDPGDLFWFVTIGAICGDGLSYYLGRRVQAGRLKEFPFFRSAQRETAERFFQKHGGKSVFLGRFIGPIRAIIPFIAGMSGMAPRAFVAWNILSGAAWAVTYLALGYFFGHAWKAVETWSTRASLVLMLFALVVVGFYWAKRVIVNNGRQVTAFLWDVVHTVGKAIREMPEIQGFVARHPTMFHAVGARFQKQRFSGLPLSLLVVAFLYTLALFFGVIEDFLSSDAIVTVDLQLHNLLLVFRNPQVVAVFLWITLLGKSVIVVSAAILVSLLLWIHRQHIYILPFWLVLAGSTLFNVLGKLAFQRPRPEFSVYTESSYSFPSGHATIAVAFYGFLIYILWKQMNSWVGKVNVLLAGLFVILAIGISRIYLGVHYFSDVWAGYLLGALWLIIGISMTEWLTSRQHPTLSEARMPFRYARELSACLLLVEILFYVIHALQYAPTQNIAQHAEDEVIVGQVTDIFHSQMPKYTETLIGRSQEPINLLILAQNNDHLIAAFRQAGWYLADPISVESTVNSARAAVFNTEYLTAPITPYFWDTQPHDLGFQKPTAAESVRQRHHARFWRTSYVTANGKRVYVGTTSLDIGIKWGLTHRIKPDIDTERDVVITDFQQADQLETVQRIQFVDPALGQNAYGDAFFTNGELGILSLKSQE